MRVKFGEPTKVRFGKVPVDRITFDEAVAAMAELRYGTVFTPNVDHVVLAEGNTRLAEAYARATLSLADGFPLVAVSRLTSLPLPEKISGSDLLPALVKEWGKRERSIFLVGPSLPVIHRCMPRMWMHGLRVTGYNANLFAPTPNRDVAMFLAKQIENARADVVLWSLGAPKQELWSDYIRRHSKHHALHVCAGAALEFFSGAAKRAPKWVSSVGLEWAHRLAQDPKRMAPRYLRDVVHFPRVAIGSLLKRTG